MLNPRRRRLATCGFAIAAVTKDGDLCAWGWGVPPHWCDSASAAEAWALCHVLKETANPTRIITDCLGLVKTAEQGTAAAITSRKQLARVWSNISGALDGRIDKLISDKVLVWMPAHKSASAIGSVCKSNGSLVTARDWRSNRLVDGLAKHAAAQGAAPKATVDLVDSAESLARHAAAQLAVATFNANHCQTEISKPDGTTAMCTRRDSQPAPAAARSKQLKPLKAPAAKHAGTAVGTAAASAAQAPSESDTSGSEAVTRRQARARARKSAKALERSRQDAAIAVVLQAPRRSSREYAIDTYRRQRVAKTLLVEEKAVSDDGWGEFLNADAIASGEQHSRNVAPSSTVPEHAPNEPGCAAVAAGSTAANAQQPERSFASDEGASTERDCEPNCMLTCFPSCFLSSGCSVEVSRGSDMPPRYSRLRPTRGSSTCTTLSSAAAVQSLLGTPAASARRGSTKGHSLVGTPAASARRDATRGQS